MHERGNFLSAKYFYLIFFVGLFFIVVFFPPSFVKRMLNVVFWGYYPRHLRRVGGMYLNRVLAFLLWPSPLHILTRLLS